MNIETIKIDLVQRLLTIESEEGRNPTSQRSQEVV
jgi:hypothetical protein